MASERGYRDKWLRYHARYEKKAERLFRRLFKQWGKDIDFTTLNVLNYPEKIRQGVNKQQLIDTYRTVYTQIGLLHGKRVGNAFNRETRDKKFFILGDFESDFLNAIENLLEQWRFDGIFQFLTQSYTQSITRVVNQALQEGQGSEEIARRIQALVNRRDFYRWQARRIARTEATAAANLATHEAAKVTGFKTVKVWISANDARTRRIPDDQYDHYTMNGVEIPSNQAFKVPAKIGHEYLRFPGDRGGVSKDENGRRIATNPSPGNVINCRCTFAIIAARDADGNLIRE